jgi:Domain of unknown function (DUF4336)
MTLSAFADGIWTDADPIRMLGTQLTSTMTVVRLADGTLLVYSPIRMNEERRAAVDALGRVAHLYAPNLFHHLWLGDWARVFPEARVHAPAGLTRKRPDLRVDRVHGAAAEPAFIGVVEEVHVDGFRLEESVLFHAPSRTLIVADLVHNVGRPRDLWSKLYTRTMGFYDRVALSRVLRWAAFSDRAAARRSIDRLLALPFERLIVGHGDAVCEDAQAAMKAALAWLP